MNFRRRKKMKSETMVAITVIIQSLFLISPFFSDDFLRRPETTIEL